MLPDHAFAPRGQCAMKRAVHEGASEAAMRRFHRILYVFDGEPRRNPSVDRALDVARHSDAELTLLKVVAEDAPEEERAAAQAALDALCRELHADAAPSVRGIDGRPKAVSCKLLAGEPHVVVIREVLREGFDLVMKTATPDEGVIARLFGTLDTRLIEQCPCPVWIDRPSPHEHYRRIMAAVDVLTHDGSELHVRVLDLASAVAAFERAELYVVNAWEIEGETGMRGRVATESARRRIEALLEQERQRHEAALEALVSPFRDRPVKIELRVVKGDPVRVVPETAKALDVDLVVLGATVRSHLVGVLVGSTAEAIIRSVECAVLVVKPPGFVSPVTLDD